MSRSTLVAYGQQLNDPQVHECMVQPVHAVSLLNYRVNTALTFSRISSSGSYDNTGKSLRASDGCYTKYFAGQPFDLNRILFNNATFNELAYKQYSPLYLSCVLILIIQAAIVQQGLARTTFALSYGLSFATISATASPPQLNPNTG